MRALRPVGLPYSQVLEQFEQENVRSFLVKDGVLQLELYRPLYGESSAIAYLDDTDAFRRDTAELVDLQAQSGVLVEYDFQPDTQAGILEKAAPYFLAGLLLLVIWVVLSSRAGAGNGLSGFTKARVHLGAAGKPVTFRDVAGADEEKAELQEIVDFLRDPGQFDRMGAKVPKGVLLIGPPGTGKTLLARAVAGEAGVTFLSISGSDFMELYVGVGASRVRDLFDQAKKMAPSIIFIDEIDAVGRQRGAGLGGGHDEREQTLNQLLVEMDGFRKNEGVIVMAATNRQDILDPALLRPGRFDRQIYVGAPDAQGRQDILKIHARDKRLDGGVDLRSVALATAGFTGADLENLLNEAAILAVRAKQPAITMGHLNEAMMKIIAGPQKRSRKQLARDLRITAVHEAGHAVAMYFLPNHDPVHQITIIPRGRAAGMTVSLPEEESSHLTRNEMYEDIVAGLGGRVAEALFCQDISTGASHDIRRVTQLARDMVAKYGMSEKIGPIAYAGDEEVFLGRDFEKTKSYSEQVAGLLDGEVRAIIDRAYNQCAKLLQENREKLLQVADFLLAHETMSGAQFKACMEGREIDPDDRGSLFEPV
ncbi:MAG TPA: ATP-dependent zinc metalloprotease FtsH [Candidatus Faecousia gallistercoris]|nr:ATP-dependent zinc metalloprotease FtsH [Candidatus Faecousia gallistercoris]